MSDDNNEFQVPKRPLVHLPFILLVCENGEFKETVYQNMSPAIDTRELVDALMAEANTRRMAQGREETVVLSDQDIEWRYLLAHDILGYRDFGITTTEGSPVTGAIRVRARRIKDSQKVDYIVSMDDTPRPERPTASETESNSDDPEIVKLKTQILHLEDLNRNLTDELRAIRTALTGDGFNIIINSGRHGAGEVLSNIVQKFIDTIVEKRFDGTIHLRDDVAPEYLESLTNIEFNNLNVVIPHLETMDFEVVRRDVITKVVELGLEMKLATRLYGINLKAQSRPTPDVKKDMDEALGDFMSNVIALTVYFITQGLGMAISDTSVLPEAPAEEAEAQ